MKKYILLSLVAGAMIFASCEPKEDNTTSQIVMLTADQITAEVIVSQKDGKNINYATVCNHTPQIGRAHV